MKKKHIKKKKAAVLWNLPPVNTEVVAPINKSDSTKLIKLITFIEFDRGSTILWKWKWHLTLQICIYIILRLYLVHQVNVFMTESVTESPLKWSVHGSDDGEKQK